MQNDALMHREALTLSSLQFTIVIFIHYKPWIAEMKMTLSGRPSKKNMVITKTIFCFKTLSL